jgi:extradiol dioxygenase family protein
MRKARLLISGARHESRPRFHLAFPVHDLEAARRFYGDVLGCPTGRESDHWIDFDLLGHQIVAHLAPELCRDWANQLALWTASRCPCAISA